MQDLEQMLASLQRSQTNRQAQTKNVNITANIDPLHNLMDNSVTKSNALARAYYRFNLTEKRCMEAMISKLHPLRLDNPLQEITLHASEYSETFGVPKEHAYRDMQTAAASLMRTVIRIEENNGVNEIVEFTVMSVARYRKHTGLIKCSFNPFIVPHLIGLRERFTKYPLKVAANFTSSYTWRFYEVLASWAQPKTETKGLFAGWIKNQPVEELMNMLGVPKSYKWDNFQKQVLNVALSELKEKANITVFVKRIKTVRKITHLDIGFIEDNQVEISLEGGETSKGRGRRKPTV